MAAMKFSDVHCRSDLAKLLGIKDSTLTYVLYGAHIDSFYVTFEIPKKNGGTRQINAPTDALKMIQERLASALYEHVRKLRNEKNIHINIAHAFEKNKSIITNAQIHRNKYIVLNYDLEHFFDSFHFGRVAGYFEKNMDFSLPPDVAIIMAQLTCYQGHLPQGAPTSPIITNLICQILDMRILKLAKKYKIDYTRYADDLTFSTNDRSFLERKNLFYKDLETEINRAGFTINQKKTRLCLRNNRQTVTGLVVNNKINVSSEYYRQTRAMAHQLYKNGYYTINGDNGTMAQLEGRFAFIDQLDHYNNIIDQEEHSFFYLSGREKQFSKFLFYKHFFALDKPLIVTEGKTDIRYLKAALKNLHEQYPELIYQNDKGKFTFKVQFLHRTKRLKYFLGIEIDGADALKNIYNFYEGKGSVFPNYYSIFSKKGTIKPQFPVILLFDNEMKTKRPLSKFLDHIKASEEDKRTIATDLCLRLCKSSNLYLSTNPLMEGKNECEIEFLFKPETRAVRLEGKELCLKSEFDTKKYFGKEIFSQYILQHYTTIDFSGFIPLLDTIRNIMKSYSDENM